MIHAAMTLCQITPHLNHHYKPTGVYNNWEELQRRFLGGGCSIFLNITAVIVVIISVRQL